MTKTSQTEAMRDAILAYTLASYLPTGSRAHAESRALNYLIAAVEKTSAVAKPERALVARE